MIKLMPNFSHDRAAPISNFSHRPISVIRNLYGRAYLKTCAVYVKSRTM